MKCKRNQETHGIKAPAPAPYRVEVTPSGPPRFKETVRIQFLHGNEQRVIRTAPIPMKGDDGKDYVIYDLRNLPPDVDLVDATWTEETEDPLTPIPGWVEAADANHEAAMSNVAPAKLERPPGHLATCLVSLLSKRSKLRQIVDQSVADMREEYFEALQGGDHKAARWIKIRGTVGMLWAAITYIGFRALLTKAAQALGLDWFAKLRGE